MSSCIYGGTLTSPLDLVKRPCLPQPSIVTQLHFAPGEVRTVHVREVVFTTSYEPSSCVLISAQTKYNVQIGRFFMCHCLQVCSNSVCYYSFPFRSSFFRSSPSGALRDSWPNVTVVSFVEFTITQYTAYSNDLRVKVCNLELSR